MRTRWLSLTARLRRLLDEAKDFLDLMLHPARRITDRDLKEQHIESAYQTEMALKTNMWRAALRPKR